MRIYFLILSLFCLLVTSCKDATKKEIVQEENLEAKKMLQGIWIDDEDGTVTMKVSGDSIVYADSTMTPTTFKVIGDTLILNGYTNQKYAITKQTANIFQFKNHTGDIIKFVKSTDSNDNYVFVQRKVVPLNQNQLIKRDTVVVEGNHKYHVYVQVNPSKYKVITTSYNDDGVQVDNIYYDNIINICFYDSGRRIYSRNILKNDLKAYVPADFISHSILSDITVDKVTADGVDFLAIVCDPNSPLYYVVRLKVSSSGHLTMMKEQ